MLTLFLVSNQAENHDDRAGVIVVMNSIAFQVGAKVAGVVLHAFRVTTPINSRTHTHTLTISVAVVQLSLLVSTAAGPQR
jgi:hypothetical protein